MALGIFPNVSPASYGRPRTFPDYTRTAGRGGGPTVQDVRRFNTGVEQRDFFSSAFAPRRALTCGMPGMPPCDTGTPVSAIAAGPTGFNGLGALGRTFPVGFDCSTVRDLLDELENLMGTPAFSSIANQTRSDARAMYETYSGFNPTFNCGAGVPVLTNMVNRVRSEIGALGIRPPEPIKPIIVQSGGGGPEDFLDKAKPMLIAGAVIVGALVLAPVIFEGVAWARAFRPEPRRAR